VPVASQDLLIERAREIGGHRHIAAYDETAEVLAALRSRGVTLAICSNWDWDLEEAIAAAGLTGTVDVTVSSAWIGARKPHRRMYDAVLDRLGIAAGDALFVGDTWTCDVEGPRAAGLVPLYLRRTHLGIDKTAPDDHHTQDVHRADDLRRVLDLLS
jgi:putative hydrolase of the HAD superfamily